MRTCLVLSSPVLRPLLPLAEPFQARVAETVEELMDLLRGAPPSAVVLLAPGEDCPPARVGWIVEAAGVVPVVAAMELVASQAETGRCRNLRLGKGGRFSHPGSAQRQGLWGW